MPPKKRKETVQKIRVANTDIHIGQTYELVHKRDFDAPQPINKDGIGTVKNQNPGVKEYRSVPYDENLRRWDTGFEVMSPSNKRISPSEREVLVQTYVSNIQEPYEKYYNTNTSATNDDFWGGNDEKQIKPYSMELYSGRIFDTTFAKDLFDLFHVLKQGKACEKGEKDYELSRDAVYNIRNIEKSMSLADEKMMNKAEAYSVLNVLVDALDPSKDDTLYTILEWLSFSNIRATNEKETLKKIVVKSFENEKTGHDVISRFLEAYKMTNTEGNKKEMEMFSIITRLNMKNKLERKRNQYYIDNELIGSNLKDAAKTALKNPKIKELVLEAFEKLQ